MFGDMYFGITLSVLKGVNNLGIVSLILPPNSLISKKASSGSEDSFEAPIAVTAVISKVSAPLNTFLIFKPVLKASPRV